MFVSSGALFDRWTVIPETSYFTQDCSVWMFFQILATVRPTATAHHLLSTLMQVRSLEQINSHRVMYHNTIIYVFSSIPNEPVRSAERRTFLQGSLASPIIDHS